MGKARKVTLKVKGSERSAKSLKSILHKSIGQPSPKKEVTFSEFNSTPDVTTSYPPPAPGHLRTRVKLENLVKSLNIPASGAGRISKANKKMKLKLRHEKLLSKLKMVKEQRKKEMERKSGQSKIELKDLLHVINNDLEDKRPTSTGSSKKSGEDSSKGKRKKMNMKAREAEISRGLDYFTTGLTH